MIKTELELRVEQLEMSNKQNEDNIQVLVEALQAIYMRLNLDADGREKTESKPVTDEAFLQCSICNAVYDAKERTLSDICGAKTEIVVGSFGGREEVICPGLLKQG